MTPLGSNYFLSCSTNVTFANHQMNVVAASFTPAGKRDKAMLEGIVSMFIELSMRLDID